MRFEEFNQPAVGDIIEIELGEELVEAIITAINGDEIVAETDSISGANLLVESYGKYWCSTDKKWKERQGPKQTRKSESVEEAGSPAQQAAIAIAMKKAGKKPKSEDVTEGFKNTYNVGDRVDGPLGTGTIVAVSKNINVDGRVKVKLDDPSRAGEDGKYKDSFVLDTTQLKHISEQGVAEGLNEFAPAGGGGNIPRGPKTPRRGPWGDNGEDPYQLRRYNRSVDFFDQFDSGGVDKQKFDKATGEYEGYYFDRDAASGITQIAYFKFDDPTKIGDNDPGVGWYYEPVDEGVAEEKQRLDPKCWDGYKKQGTKMKGGVRVNNCVKESMDVNSLAKISDEALDKAYGYGRSTPSNTFGWQANVMSATYAKKLIDAGETDIEKIADAIHKGWNVTAQKFVQDPNQFDDTEKLRAAGKLDAKLEQRAKLMKINYAQLPDDEKEKDRVVARALLQAINGEQGVAENDAKHVSISDENLKKLAVKWWNNDQDPRVEEFLHKRGLTIGQYLTPPVVFIGYVDDKGYFEAIASWDHEVLENSHVSEAEYQGRNVPLGKPMQGDVKKFKVYVRDPSTGNVKKVNFGDPNMRIKKSNPKRRKSFRARHNCSNPGPRTKARYWSCRKW